MSQQSETPEINAQRYWDRIIALGEITDPDKPYTRRSFSQLFLEGREWLTKQMQALDMETHIDAAGNLIGRLQGKDLSKGSILIGSHSDSVPNGGRFDGMAGIIAGLECVASWRERGIHLNHSVEVVDYLAEEPSEWGISCVGSRGITGFLNTDLLATPHPQTSETLSDAIRRMGGNPDKLAIRDDVAASFELHIEQGRVLENEKLDIGVVTGIVGIVRLAITFKGQAGHAGTTPMDIRKDPAVAASRAHWEATLAARKLWENSGHYLTATCGQIFLKPNASNVVPGSAQLIFDIRSDDKSTLERFVAELEIIAKACARDEGATVSEFERMTDTYPISCDEQLMKLLEAAAVSQKISHRRMPSGAGHDAAFLSHLAPAAMVFVPSKNGVSQRPDEWTEAEELAKGTSVMMAAVEEFDRSSKI